MAVAERFVIITKRGDRYLEKTSFYLEDGEQDAISLIMNLVATDDETTEVVRVFKLDEFGNVMHYRLELNGFRPVLKAIEVKAIKPIVVKED